ncbi:MAG: hypothetical protein J3R72DRAFT_438372, partial [Linnemannia gamsii]
MANCPICKSFFYVLQRSSRLSISISQISVVSCLMFPASPPISPSPFIPLFFFRVPASCFLTFFPSFAIHRSPCPFLRLHIQLTV